CLREYLQTYERALMLISHAPDLVDEVVNAVFFHNPTRQVIDIYSMGQRAYLKQREVDERRRRRERASAEKNAAALYAQADKMRAKATKAVAAQNMAKRADRMLAGLSDKRVEEKVANLRFPTPVACGKVPLTASGL